MEDGLILLPVSYYAEAAQAPTAHELAHGQDPGLGASRPEVSSPKIPGGVWLRPRAAPALSGRGPLLKTRQLWEGTVTEVRAGGFAAVLSDKTNPENPDEEVSIEFDRAEVSADDMALIAVGASFYWIIGSETTAAGQVKNVSMLQFRRLPGWTEGALRQAEQIAGRLADLLREEA